nr:unnamed protein product [Digitaria exilis]
MADVLPDDLLAFVLARLSPRWLATSRRVCRSWRDAIDGHRLLRADLLPRSLGGIFLRANNVMSPLLFARPSSPPAIRGDLGGIFRAMDTMELDLGINDHCNGLLLLDDFPT